MEKLLAILGAALPKDKIVEDLMHACAEWLGDQTKENEASIHLYCQLLMVNVITDGKQEKADDLMEDWEKQKKRDELFNINKNKN